MWENEKIPPPKQSLVFMTLEERPFENIVGIGENAGNQHFLLTSAPFSILSKTNQDLWVTIILSSANAFNLEESKLLLLGKELTLYQTKNFRLVQS